MLSKTGAIPARSSVCSGGRYCSPRSAPGAPGFYNFNLSGTKKMNAKSTVGKWLRSFLYGAMLLGTTAQTAFATAILTSSRAAIGPGYTVDWGAPGPDLTQLGSTFTQGPVTVSGANAFAIFNGSSYNSDFLASDWVLALYDLNSGPLAGVFSIAFASAVSSAGAQLQALSYGAFTGTISAFDSSNILLGVFNVAGNTGTSGDGSAVFAGIVSDSVNISRIEFAGFGDGAGINHLSASTASVPEPGTLLLLMGPLAFLVAARRRRNRV